jgi:hypothetical protein
MDFRMLGQQHQQPQTTNLALDTGCFAFLSTNFLVIVLWLVFFITNKYDDDAAFLTAAAEWRLCFWNFAPTVHRFLRSTWNYACHNKAFQVGFNAKFATTQKVRKFSTPRPRVDNRDARRRWAGPKDGLGHKDLNAIKASSFTHVICISLAVTKLKNYGTILIKKGSMY